MSVLKQNLSDVNDAATSATRQAAQNAIDRADSAFNTARDQTATTVARLASQAESLARRGADVVRDSALQVRERATNVGDQTVRYVKDEPVKSVLIAAAAGATLMALVSLVRSARRNSR